MPFSKLKTTFMILPSPEALSVCPMFDLSDVSSRGFSGDRLDAKTFPTAAHSMGSPVEFGLGSIL